MVEQLKARPGQWAVVEDEGDSVRLSNAAQPYRARGCQITVQGGRLFARWPDQHIDALAKQRQASDLGPAL